MHFDTLPLRHFDVRKWRNGGRRGYFAAIAAVAAIALVIYQRVVKRLDEKKLKH